MSDETIKESWIWRLMPVEKGQMTDVELDEWFEKCMLPLYLRETSY